jgi:signal transduction histidine kinase
MQANDNSTPPGARRGNLFRLNVVPLTTKTWPILTAAFGALIVVMVLTGFNAFRKATQIYAETVNSHESYQHTSALLASLESELYLSEIVLRDYLLDPSHLTAQRHRDQLVGIRREMERHLANLDEIGKQEGLESLAKLSRELDNYWNSLEPVFEWSPRQKMLYSAAFLRQNVLPQREAVSDLANDIRETSESNLNSRQAAIARQQEAFAAELRKTMILSMGLALLIAIAVIFRVGRLEGRERQNRERAEGAERELRSLSRELVSAQEEERKRLSRELHDAVGQTLTALRMELGNIERNRGADKEFFLASVSEAKHLAERTLRTVRDLAMGLRPSMLDDLGLGPAVEWQARDYSRRGGTPINVELEGDLELMPERHRTCIYRVVQEALTNCAKHSKAKEIRVVLHGREDGISLRVEDDGVGMPSDSRGRGLGLISIEERVRQLEGNMRIQSEPQSGTVLTVDIPYQRELAQ